MYLGLHSALEMCRFQSCGEIAVLHVLKVSVCLVLTRLVGGCEVSEVVIARQKH